ncbi:MAG: hypothetical protein A3J24_07300 [Deltaproteobacteria bacterium RIFCSPLOWO2_02_FULL_53_8]|nr:MAG: hypothetical protein A3J24_07300 [Deltaproteobacteria bacterium RIFCSPLOWO2_02_FULL_53_8]
MILPYPPRSGLKAHAFRITKNERAQDSGCAIEMTLLFKEALINNVVCATFVFSAFGAVCAIVCLWRHSRESGNPVFESGGYIKRFWKHFFAS